MENAIYNFVNGTFGAVNDVCGIIFNIPVNILGVPLSTLLLGAIALATLIGALVDIIED